MAPMPMQPTVVLPAAPVAKDSDKEDAAAADKKKED